MAKNEWVVWPHYPRNALARAYLGQVELGIRTFTLFAPRGFGKTEFIKQDLLPAAAAAGLRCIYVDLWLIDGDPVESLIQQLRPESLTAADTGRSFPALRRVVRRLKRSNRADATVKGGFLGQSVEVGLHRTAPAGSNRAEALLQAMTNCLDADGRTILLVLDEVQSLASPKYESIVKTLRAIFQAHDARLVRVFTGSSRSGLDRMFRRNKAALFQQGGTEIVLPPLDHGFVTLISNWCTRQTQNGLLIDVDLGLQVLRELAFSARLFRKAVEQVLVGRAANLREAGTNVQGTDLLEPTLAAKLVSLTDLQRVLLHAIWMSGTDVYSTDSRAAYAQALGCDAVSTSEAQGAIRRLERLELIYRAANGEYTIEPPELELLIERNSLRLADKRGEGS